jgi:hypothetical protein
MAPISGVIYNYLYDEKARTNFLHAKSNIWLKDPIDRLTAVLRPAGIITNIQDDCNNSTSFTVSVMSAGMGFIRVPAEATIYYNKLYSGNATKTLYAVIGPSPELFGAGDTGRHGSFVRHFDNDITTSMQLRGVVATIVNTESGELKPTVVHVDNQQYAIGFYIGEESETEHGILDDVTGRVLSARKFYNGSLKSMRSVAALKLGTLVVGNTTATVNDATGEEEANLRQFLFYPPPQWTVRKIVYEDESPIPNENPDYTFPSIVYEKLAQDLMNITPSGLHNTTTVIPHTTAVPGLGASDVDNLDDSVASTEPETEVTEQPHEDETASGDPVVRDDDIFLDPLGTQPPHPPPLPTLPPPPPTQEFSFDQQVKPSTNKGRSKRKVSIIPDARALLLE